MKYALTCLGWLLVAFCTQLHAQQKIVLTGKIIDDDTEEPVAFSNVYVKGTNIGTTSDLDGVYILEVDLSTVQEDTLIANSLGYTDTKKLFDRTLAEQTLNFRLKSSEYSIQTVTIVAGENPANEIVRNIIKNKKKNNPAAYDSYQVELYSKVELDLDNISDEMKQRRVFKDFQFIFENVDSVSDVKPFLPAYVAERLYDVYYLKSANERKEMIKAQKVSGINNQSVVDFIDMMHEKYNVYENWINLLGKEFVSPFSNNALGFYEFYILDSTYIKNTWSYKIKFKPKRRQENTFYGDFWVAMDDYAVEIVNMRMSPDVNINLVNRVIIYAEFDLNKDSLWLPSKEKTVIDFSSNQNDKGLSVIGRTTYSYKDYQLNPTALQPSEFRKLDPNNVSPHLIAKPDSFWAEARHEKLSKNEESVYQMVDSIKNVPIYRTWSSIVTLLGTGFQVVGPIEIGEYWDIINYNRCEGYRLGLGVGTSTKLSKKFRVYGYAGYGLADHRWKYRGDFQYVFNRERRIQMGMLYHNTITFESVNSEETPSQSLLAGWLRRPVDPKILGKEEFKIYYQHGWKNGIQARLALIHRTLTPQNYYYAKETSGFNMVYQPDANDSTKLDTRFTTFETVFKLRFAFKERLLLGNFSSISLGSKYPIVTAQYTAGIAGVLGSKYNYHKFLLSVDDWFNVGIAGWFDYNISAGMALGTLPYLLLESHPGNEAYFYNMSSFNSMNNFEFVSDKYVAWRIEHHMDGLILDKIPLIRRLKWRNVWAFRGVWGTLSDANYYANRFNHYHYEGDKKGSSAPFYGRFGNMPYMEASIGIENIFKIIRVDGLWRLTYRDNPNTQKFSVRVTLNFNF